MTEDIIELTVDLKKNGVEIKKKVTGILSLFSVIASYTNSKNQYTLPLIAVSQHIFYLIDLGIYQETATTELEIFCNTVNSITFNFTKKDLKINIQKIDLSLFKIG